MTKISNFKRSFGFKIFVVFFGVLILGFLGWQISLVFKGTKTLSPVLFNLWGFEVRFYGLILGISALLGLILVLRLNRVLKVISDSELSDLALISVLVGVLGARLGFVVQNFSYYFAHPTEIFAFRQGGLSIHGGLLLGAIILWFYARRKKLHFFKLADLLMPGVVLAMALGRFGNFFNQELYGYPTNLFWKMYVAVENRLEGFENFEFFHPVFLYTMLGELLILFLVLLFLKRLKTGQIFLYSLLGISLGRFLIEFVRIGDKILFQTFTLAQIVTAVLILGAIISLVVLKDKRERMKDTRG